ncbi:hematopoietic death receptor isoform X2 [Megalops cyprinoides]|uniref:hematopoietic death receptor isoform X2 n=1 Tax=Megalops cyprinoides TaxID=118141 RepID=UPI001863A71A|nr:hematopoietic death receptor isoform X2 [Megalops cyprinoides]
MTRGGNLSISDFRMSFIKCKVVFSIFIFTLVGTAELSSSTAQHGDRDRNRVVRDTICRENMEYKQDDFCCLNCPAGTYVKEPCSKAGERGKCETCDYDTYMEHDNGLKQCFMCTKCRRDQVETEPCTSTRDRGCQCKPGSFCLPDQACEVCKKCSKCKADEVKVKNCTTTSNTVCRQKPPAPNTISAEAAAVGIVIPSLIIIVLGVSYYFWKKRQSKKTEVPINPSEMVKIHMGENNDRTMEESQNSRNAELEVPQRETQPFLQDQLAVGAKPSAFEDEDRGLGDSLPNTTSSSQTSLSAQPTAPSSSSSPHPSPETQRQPAARGNVTRKLLPLMGEESLKKSFDLFGEYLDFCYCKRFFRKIGLSDNAIKAAEGSPPADRVYELLTTWMEKEGLKAEINYLLDVLLELGQRLSAENIICKVIENEYYKYEDECN